MIMAICIVNGTRTQKDFPPLDGQLHRALTNEQAETKNNDNSNQGKYQGIGEPFLAPFGEPKTELFEQALLRNTNDPLVCLSRLNHRTPPFQKMVIWPESILGPVESRNAVLVPQECLETIPQDRMELSWITGLPPGPRNRKRRVPAEDRRSIISWFPRDHHPTISNDPIGDFCSIGVPGIGPIIVQWPVSPGVYRWKITAASRG
jgi:hypothetical protein